MGQCRNRFYLFNDDSRRRDGFLFHRAMSGKVQKAFLGFAAGVMIAASVWSLLIPAIKEAEANGQTGWIPAAGGFILGIAFLYGLDWLIPHLHPGVNKQKACPHP